MLDSVQIPSARFSHPQSELATSAESSDVGDLFASAINSPIEFAGLNEFIFPGDRIAIALLGSLRQPLEAVRALLPILRTNIPNLEISIVVSPFHQSMFDEMAQFVAEYTREYSTANSAEPVLHLHDPSEKNSVALIAVSKSGEAIYVNRILFDADVVIPVGSLVADDLEIGAIVYPEFSSESTLVRFRERPASADLRNEINVAEQSIGADFNVLVVPGPGSTVSAVYAGQRACIKSAASTVAEACWSVKQQAEGQVVVATIEANPEYQTWEQFFQAVAAASSASNNVQQIVICSEIRLPPSDCYREILNLQFETDYDLINRHLASASELHRSIPSILESVAVYLKSHLSQSDVEELGLGFIESDDELQRIIDRAESGIFLRDAHLCRIT